MRNGEKIIELLAEMVKGQDRLTEEVSLMKDEVSPAKNEKRISKFELTVFKS